MKATFKRITPIIIIVIVIYLIGTPIGALRFAIARTGYPVSAITIKLSEKPYNAKIKDNQTMYSVVNPPIEKATQGILENWIVTKYGAIYWGSFYGW